MNSGYSSPLQSQLHHTPGLERACLDPHERWLVLTPDGALLGARAHEPIGEAAHRALVDTLMRGAAEASGWRFALQAGGGGAVIIAERCGAQGAARWATPELPEALEIDLRRRANGVIIGGPDAPLAAQLWAIAAHEALDGQALLCVGDVDPTTRRGATIALDRPADAGASERVARLAGQLDGVFWDELRAADELRTLGAGVGARSRWASVRATRADEALRALSRWVAPLAPGFALHHFVFLTPAHDGEGFVAHAITQQDGMWMTCGEPPASALALIEALFPVEALLPAPPQRATTSGVAPDAHAPPMTPPEPIASALEPISVPSFDEDEADAPAGATPVEGLSALDLVPTAPPEPTLTSAQPSDTLEVLEALEPTPMLELSAAAESFQVEPTPMEAVSTVQELFEDSDAPGEPPWTMEEIPAQRLVTTEWPREPSSEPTRTPAPEALIFDRSERRHTSPHPALKRPVPEPSAQEELSEPDEPLVSSSVSSSSYTPPDELGELSEPDEPLLMSSSLDPQPIPGAISEATTQVVSADLLAGVLNLSEPSDVVPDEASSSLAEASSEVDDVHEMHAASTQVASADLLAGVLHLSDAPDEPGDDRASGAASTESTQVVSADLLAGVLSLSDPEQDEPESFSPPPGAPEIYRPRTMSGGWSALSPEPIAEPIAEPPSPRPRDEAPLDDEWSAPSTIEGLPFATSESGELQVPEPPQAETRQPPMEPALEPPGRVGMQEPSEFMFEAPLDDFAPPPSAAEPAPEVPAELADFEALGLDRLVPPAEDEAPEPQPTPEPEQPAVSQQAVKLTESSLAAQRWLDELSDVGDPLDELDVSDPTPSLLDRVHSEGLDVGLEAESEREDLSLKLRAWRRKARGRRGPDGLSELSEAGMSSASDSQDDLEDEPHSQESPSGELELPIPNLDDLFEF